MGKALQTWAAITALVSLLNPRSWLDIGFDGSNSYKHIKHRSQKKKRRMARRVK